MTGFTATAPGNSQRNFTRFDDAAQEAAESGIFAGVDFRSSTDDGLAAGQALGLSLKVESVNVRPGKPTFFGVLADGRRMLGLPGNPASAFVCAEMFLKPILAAYQGAPAEPVTITARLTQALPANGPREHWMRAKLAWADDGAVTALPFRDQDSALVTVFASADALLRRAVGAPAAAIGDAVDVLPLWRP